MNDQNEVHGDTRDPNPGDSERVTETQRELDADRRWERRLWPKALVALAAVALLVVIRQVLFP